MSDKSPHFKNPPVVEVAYGVFFRPIANFYTPHAGLIWQEFKEEYPDLEDRDPIMRHGHDVPHEVMLTVIPPLRRVWMISKDAKDLIQLQSDAFLCNWRKGNEASPYPSHKNNFPKFQGNLARFKKSVSKLEGLGEIHVRGLELTYINHIEQGTIWNSIQDIGKILPDYAKLCENKSVWGVPTGLSTTLIYDLPSNKGKLWIKSFEGQQVDGEKVFVVELSARYTGEDITTDRDIESWFDMAHEKIVEGFAHDEFSSQNFKEGCGYERTD